MVYKGHIRNGMVVLDAPSNLQEGTEVEVVVHQEVSSTESQPESEIPSLYDRLQSIIGKGQGLPSDFAQNHDHYIHGAPKR